MKLILKRTYYDDATLGMLSIEGQDNPVWFTIECPWLDNASKISCIPEGTYKVIPYNSSDHPDVWQILNVLNRHTVLIHIGNWVHDVKGCIAVGESLCYIKYGSDYKKAVSNSGKTIQKIKNAIGYPAEFELKITS